MYIIDSISFYYCPLFLFSFKGRLYIFFYAQSRCATGSPPLFLLLLPILFFCVSFFYSITLTKMFYYFRPHQSDPATLIFFTRGGPPLGPSESKWATRLSLTNFWHNKKTLDEMLADDLREREEPPTLFTRTIRLQKDTSCSSLDCFLFPFWFLSRLRPKRINEHSEKKNFWTSTCFFLLLSALYSVFRCETRVEKEQKPSTQFLSFSRRKKKCREFTNSTQKNKIVNSVIESSIHPSV